MSFFSFWDWHPGLNIHPRAKLIGIVLELVVIVLESGTPIAKLIG